MGWILEHKQGRRLTGSSEIPTVAGQNNALMNYGESLQSNQEARHACQSRMTETRKMFFTKHVTHSRDSKPVEMSDGEMILKCHQLQFHCIAFICWD